MKALAPASQFIPFLSPKDPAKTLGLFNLFFWLFEVVEKTTDKVIIRQEKRWNPLKGKAMSSTSIPSVTPKDPAKAMEMQQKFNAEKATAMAACQGNPALLSQVSAITPQKGAIEQLEAIIAQASGKPSQLPAHLQTAHNGLNTKA